MTDRLTVFNGGGSSAPHPTRRPAPNPTSLAADAGGPVLTFGRHKGKAVSDVPESYLAWCLTQRWLDPGLRAEVERVLAIDQPEPGHDPDPDPASAAVAMPLVVFEWRQAMLAEFGDDPLLMQVVRRGLAHLKRLCSSFTNQPWPEEADHERV
jgi:uncharacterized protein (DUF3820 family)